MVIQSAHRAILDTVGAMIAGGAHPAIQALRSVHPMASGTATLATGGKADPESAALINGMAAHVWDIDDTSYTGIMHGSAVILPAILAAAETIQPTDADITLAFVTGSEITYCLADLCTHKHYFHGWWSTTTLGLIGATAAVARLFKLDPTATAHAIGLAASAASGAKAVFGTDGKPYLVGDACRRALSFVTAARAGLSGPADAFENPRGFLHLLNNGHADSDVLATLGHKWRLSDPGLLFKTNPVCSAAHAAIDQMTALMDRLNATPDQLARIHAEVPELVDISLVYPTPTTAQEAQFSLPFALASAALYGHVRFQDLLSAPIPSKDIANVMQIVTVERALDLSTDAMRTTYPESARVTLTLKNGNTATGFCGSARGMPDTPLTNDDLITKFNAALAFAGHDAIEPPDLDHNPAALFAQILSETPLSNQRSKQ